MTIRPFEQHTPNLANTVYVDPSAIIIGDVSIDSCSSVWPLVVVRGDVNTITVGSHTNIQDGTIVHVTHDGPFTPGGVATAIGNRVTIGHQTIVHACEIQDSCLIGMGAKIMDGAIIESRVLLAAGSLVGPGKILKSGYLYKGTPAKPVRPLTEQEIAHIDYSADYYYQLSQRHLAATNRSDR